MCDNFFKHHNLQVLSVLNLSKDFAHKFNLGRHIESIHKLTSIFSAKFDIRSLLVSLLQKDIRKVLVKLNLYVLSIIRRIAFTYLEIKISTITSCLASKYV